MAGKRPEKVIQSNKGKCKGPGRETARALFVCIKTAGNGPETVGRYTAGNPTRKRPEGENMSYQYVPEKKKKKSGRPRKMTEDRLRKVYDGFSHGLTVPECAVYVGMSARTLYDYINADPDLSHYIEGLRKKPAVIAKLNVSRELAAGNVDLSKWYLERKCRDEFSTRAEINAGIEAGKLAEKEDGLREFMEGFLKSAE